MSQIQMRMTSTTSMVGIHHDPHRQKFPEAKSHLDLLDEFSAAKIEPKQPRVSPDQVRPATTAAPAEPALEDAFSDDEFAKQLQAGMAELLGDMENSVSVPRPSRTITRH